MLSRADVGTPRSTIPRRRESAVVILTIICSLPCVLAHGAESGKVAVPQCAQLCVQHVCRLLGVPIDLGAIQERMPVQAEGNSLLEIQQTLAWIGIDGEGWELDFDGLCSSKSPVVAHMGDHFVVVEAADGSHVRLLDRVGRRRTVDSASFREGWTGKVLVVDVPPPERLLPAYRPAARSQPRMKFTTLVKDVGEVRGPVDSISVTFPFANVGGAGLRVEKIRTDCTCSVPTKPDVPVPPNGTGAITVQYRPGRHVGPFEHAIFVESNDPLFRVLQLTMAGNVVQGVVVDPPVLRVGKVVRGERRSRFAVVKYSGDTPLSIQAVPGGPPWVTVEVEAVTEAVASRFAVSPGAEVRQRHLSAVLVAVTVDSALLPLGKATHKVVLHTNMEHTPTVTLQLDADIVGTADIRPEVVFLGETEPGILARAEVSMSLHDGGTFRIQAIRTPVAGMQCEYPRSEVREALLRFTVIPASPSGLMTTDVTIEYLRSGASAAEEVSVPVCGYVGRAGALRPPVDRRTTGSTIGPTAFRGRQVHAGEARALL